MNLNFQMLAALCWMVIGLATIPLLWSIAQPYLRSWSRAQRRATNLLRNMLTAEQFRQLTWRGYLEVSSPTEPQRVYRIPRSKGYVQVIENGRAIMRLCLQPVECLPDADIVVLHKLMIEGNEKAYLQKANKYMCIDC